MSKDDFYATIKRKKEKIKKLEDEIVSLEIERDELIEKISLSKDRLNEAERDANTAELLFSGYNISRDKSTRVKLYSDTATTPIIDSFYSSDKEFLIFENAFSSWQPQTYRFSLVVVKNQPYINSRSSNLTMTDLKKSVGTILGDYIYSVYKETSRMFPLIDEMMKVSKQALKEGSFAPFSMPCVLKGQTFRDQTGYGKEFHGDALVYEKNYGDASSFLIIGVFIEE